MEYSKSGVPEMSVLTLRTICVDAGGYENPLLNEKLFLHMKGFGKISEAIGEYRNVKVGWCTGAWVCYRLRVCIVLVA